MKKVAVLLANGFEDMEAISLIDVLRRGELDVSIVGVGGEVIESAHNLKVFTDILIENVSADDFDLVVLPGGLPGATNLADSPEVQKLLKEMDSKNRYIGAICAAPIALHKAGVLKDNYTAYPSWEKNIREEGYVSDKMVVKDKNILTSKGPATAICFGIALVRELRGDEVADAVKAGLLADYCEN